MSNVELTEVEAPNSVYSRNGFDVSHWVNKEVNPAMQKAKTEFAMIVIQARNLATPQEIASMRITYINYGEEKRSLVHERPNPQDKSVNVVLDESFISMATATAYNLNNHQIAPSKTWCYIRELPK